MDHVRYGQRHDEAGAAARTFGHPDSPAVCRDDRARDCQPQAVTGFNPMRGTVTSEEGLENALAVAKRNPGPTVFNSQLEHVTHDLAAHIDWRAFWGIFAGVQQQ